MDDKFVATCFKLAILLIGLMGIVAIVTESTAMAIVMVGFSIIWFGFFIVLNFLEVADIFMDVIKNIWQNVDEHWPRR